MIITVTPETVLKAYKATGLNPIFSKWGDGTTCGCAITAVLKHQKPDVLKHAQEFSEELADLLGASQAWVCDFVNGFDHTQRYHARDQTVYDLGQQCRAAVLETYPDLGVNA